MSESHQALKALATHLSFSVMLNPGTPAQVLVTNPNDARILPHTDPAAHLYYTSNRVLLDYPTPPITVIISGAPACPASVPLCPKECDKGIGDNKKKCKKQLTVHAAAADYATVAPVVDKALIKAQVRHLQKQPQAQRLRSLAADDGVRGALPLGGPGPPHIWPS